MGAGREPSAPLEKLVQPCGGEALLKGMFTLCFQMDHEEQGILGVYKLSKPGPTQSSLVTTVIPKPSK